MTAQQRFESTRQEIERIYGFRQKQGEVLYQIAELDETPNEIFGNRTTFTIPKGDIMVKKWIDDSGFVVCKKSEAECLLIVGEKRDGCFVLTKHKNYWLKSKLI
jgi:hypothetical protein